MKYITLFFAVVVLVLTWRTASLAVNLVDINNEIVKTRNILLTYKQEVSELERPDEIGYITRLEYGRDLERLNKNHESLTNSVSALINIVKNNLIR